MATLQDALNQLAQQINLTAIPKPGAIAGNQFIATLSLPGFSTQPPVISAAAHIGTGVITPPHPGQLTVSGTLEVSKIVQEPINLKWISENVRFDPESDPPSANDLTIPPDIAGQMPIQPSIPVPGTEIPDGVPGTIGLLTGTIPVFEIINETISANVSIEARWRVLDENKIPVATFGWSTNPGITGQGSEFFPPPEHILNNAVNLALIPPFVDLVSLSPPAPVARWIQAHFRLSAAGVSTSWIDLEQYLPLPPIPIPTLLFLFEKPNFNIVDNTFSGFVLVVFPKNSPLGPDSLLQTLKDLNEKLTTVKTLLGVVLDLFFFRLNDPIMTVLNNAQDLNIAATKADEISNLNDIDVISYGFWDMFSGHFNDIEAEDEMASLIFFGPPGRSLQAFNDRGFSDDEGQLNVKIGLEMVAAIATLYRSTTDDFDGDAAPPGCVSVAKRPQGCRGLFCGLGGGHDITTFGDEFSSLRFGW
ncbi:MAG TPA: hypothetical protein VIV62_03030 [Chthoniobacterales bacterium]|jgi:hypothetical protein